MIQFLIVTVHSLNIVILGLIVKRKLSLPENNHPPNVISHPAGSGLESGLRVFVHYARSPIVLTGITIAYIRDIASDVYPISLVLQPIEKTPYSSSVYSLVYDPHSMVYL